MSQQFLFPNFYNTTLSASLSSTATTMSVTTFRELEESPLLALSGKLEFNS